MYGRNIRAIVNHPKCQEEGFNMAKNVSLLVACCAAGLVGCGGGGSDSSAAGATATPPPVTTIPTGVYVGTTSTGRTSIGLVLDDGSYYVLYSVRNNPSLIAGAIQGTGTASNGSFSSTNGKDINLEGLGLLSSTISASYTEKKSFNGTVVYSSLNQTITFTGTYDAQYEVTPSLAAIAGSYSVQAGSPLGVDTGTVTISSTGTITATTRSGCKVTGTVTPKVKGNAYTVSGTFGGAPCWYANRTMSGAAYFDASTRRLYAVGLTTARDAGIILAGTKL